VRKHVGSPERRPIACSAKPGRTEGQTAVRAV
jgi:hypothetical protein